MTITRPLLTPTFWLDALERALKTFAQTMLALLGILVTTLTTDVEWSWTVAVLTVVIPTVSSVLMSIISSGIGEPGSASLLNPAPPDTLKDDPPPAA